MLAVGFLLLHCLPLQTSTCVLSHVINVPTSVRCKQCVTSVILDLRVNLSASQSTAPVQGASLPISHLGRRRPGAGVGVAQARSTSLWVGMARGVEAVHVRVWHKLGAPVYGWVWPGGMGAVHVWVWHKLGVLCVFAVSGLRGGEKQVVIECAVVWSQSHAAYSVSATLPILGVQCITCPSASMCAYLILSLCCMQVPVVMARPLVGWQDFVGGHGDGFCTSCHDRWVLAGALPTTGQVGVRLEVLSL